MKKTRIAICAMLLSLTLLVTFFVVELAYANEYDCGSLLWGSYWNQSDLTKQRLDDALDMLYDMFYEQNGLWTEIYHGIGSSCNRVNILDKSADYEAAHTGISFFHYGHWAQVSVNGKLWMWDEYNEEWIFYADVPVSHIAYPDYYNIKVKDSDIYDSMDGFKHYGVFLWTCVAGEGIDGAAGSYDNDWYGYPYIPYYYIGTGARGMPFAFTGESNLDPTGYESPDTSSRHCFMGWKGLSKDLADNCEYSEEFNYQDFLVLYYYYVLSITHDYTIKQALDRTCQDIWEADLIYSPIWTYNAPNPEYPEMGPEFVPSGFRVWGNGNLKFPKEGWS